MRITVLETSKRQSVKLKRTKQIREAFCELSFSRFLSESTKLTITNEILVEMLRMLKQTGSLLIRHSTSDREQRRDKFCECFREWLSRFNNRAVISQFDDHRAEVALCENAFREIYSSLGKCPVGQVDASVAAWAALSGVGSDTTEVNGALTTTPVPFIGPNMVFLSSEALRIDIFGITGVDPDAVTERYAYNLAGYLRMLGHSHGWFSGANLVIPAQTEVPPGLRKDRSALYLAEAWNQLEDHWDKLRYFETSSLNSERRSYASGNDQQTVDTIVFEHDWPQFLEVEVARTRLRRQVFEIAVHVAYSSATAERVQDPTKVRVKLFPRGLISSQEAIATLALDMCYGLKLERDKGEYLGLKLTEWLRGYSLLQFCCIRGLALNEISDGVCSLDLNALLHLAEQANMSRERMLRFIEQITFQKNSRDLFDTPLIRTISGEYIIFPHIQSHAAIFEALTSRINSLVLQVERKGSGFEDEVRCEFGELGAVVRRLKYGNAEGKFECDGAVLWGTHLFLIECKAYTLPQPSGADLFFFRVKQAQAAEQIVRIKRHLEENPSILEKEFGCKLDITKTTLCVVNLAPFWTSISGSVKYYDRNSLIKFSEGRVSSQVAGSNDPSEERTLYKFWLGEVATPEDLIRQMNGPFQHLNEMRMWEVKQIIIPISNTLVLASKVLVRRPDPQPEKSPQGT